MKYLRWYFPFWKAYRGFFFFLCAMCLLDASASVAVPLVLKSVIDRLEVALQNPTHQTADPAWFGFVVLAAGFFIALAHTFPFFRAWMNLNLEAGIRRRWFDMLLNRDQAFFLRHRSGDLITRLTDDIARYPKIAWFGCSGIFRALNGFSIVTVSFLAMLSIHPGLTLLALIPVPFAFWLFTRLKDQLREAWSKNQQAISKTTNAIESAVSGIRVIKSVNAQNREAGGLEAVLEDRLNVEYRATRLSVGMSIFYEFASQASQVIIVAAGGYLVIQNELTLGGYYAFFTCLAIIVFPMLDLPNLLVTSRQAFVCIDRLEELMEGKGVPPAKPAGRQGFAVNSVGLYRASFSYHPPGSKASTALEDVSLEVSKGETLAIVGRIGSGKTTLLTLLSGMLPPNQGQLMINSRPADAKLLRDLHQDMGYIAQEPLVLSGTVTENIRFHRNYGEARVEQASRQARFDQDVGTFPAGYAQSIGHRGVSISGGQKQRLTIARALIGHPGVLLMDDVTASLDASNEKGLWDEISRLDERPAVIVVTHRKATALRADRILFLKEGRVAGYDTFERLTETCPEFVDLLEDEDE